MPPLLVLLLFELGLHTRTLTRSWGRTGAVFAVFEDFVGLLESVISSVLHGRGRIRPVCTPWIGILPAAPWRQGPGTVAAEQTPFLIFPIELS